MTDIVLRDGSTIAVRPLGRGDEEAMLVFLRGLSVASRALRFFSAATSLEAQARRAVDVDGADAYGLIAVSGDGGIVGHAARCGERGQRRGRVRRADSAQGRGLATTLLGHLAAHAHDHGVATFTATCCPRTIG